MKLLFRVILMSKFCIFLKFSRRRRCFFDIFKVVEFVFEFFVLCNNVLWYKIWDFDSRVQISRFFFDVIAFFRAQFLTFRVFIVRGS